MKFRISVTATDIKKGRQRDPKHCPLARAIRRHKPLREAEVGTWYYYPKVGSGKSLPLPDEAVNFRHLYDVGTSGLKPFEFVLTLPDDIFDPPQASGG